MNIDICKLELQNMNLKPRDIVKNKRIFKK